jgi:hypothetical protein
LFLDNFVTLIPGGSIVAEATAHAGWITGMDLASLSGLLITSSEDGFIRVIRLLKKQDWKSFQSFLLLADLRITKIALL